MNKPAPVTEFTCSECGRQLDERPSTHIDGVPICYDCDPDSGDYMRLAHVIMYGSRDSHLSGLEDT